MKINICLLLVSTLILFSCQEKKKLDNPEILKKVLLEYFDGIKEKDLNKMNKVTTRDFVLFEDGKVWNNDSMINMLNGMPPYKATFAFDNFNTNIDVDNASIYYFNHMDLTMNDTLEVKYDWIESASFKKIDGEWKINFLHSTVRN